MLVFVSNQLKVRHWSVYILITYLTLGLDVEYQIVTARLVFTFWLLYFDKTLKENLLTI